MNNYVKMSNFQELQKHFCTKFWPERSALRHANESLSCASANNRGWSGGAKVLGKLAVPGRPTNLDNSRASR